MSFKTAGAGLVANKLQQEIELLAKRFALVPTFAPHVTLLGGIEQPEQQVLQTAAQVAAKLEASGSCTH